MTKHTAGPWAVTGGQTVHQPNKDHYKPICKAYGKYHKDADKSEAEAKVRAESEAKALLEAKLQAEVQAKTQAEALLQAKAATAQPAPIQPPIVLSGETIFVPVATPKFSEKPMPSLSEIASKIAFEYAIDVRTAMAWIVAAVNQYSSRQEAA